MAEYKVRRRYPRYHCDAGVRIHPEKSKAGYWGTVSDISFGGCYIYTFSPLPVNQMITIVLRANEGEINVAGRVVSSHAGVGMGVAFHNFVVKDGEAHLKAYLDHLAKQPRAKDSLSVSH